MTNAKTKSKFIENTIADDAEKRANDEAAVSAGFQKAESFAAPRDSAMHLLDGFISGLNKGEDCDTLELMIAERDVEKYNKLYENALLDAEALRKRLGSGDLRLAKALSAALGSIIPVPVHVLSGRAAQAPLMAPEDAAPVIFVMPGDKDPEQDGMGALTGDVVIHYHRSAMYAPLRVSEIEIKAKALGYRALHS